MEVVFGAGIRETTLSACGVIRIPLDLKSYVSRVKGSHVPRGSSVISFAGVREPIRLPPVGHSFRAGCALRGS
jgi:hypothetical protein